MASPDVCVFRWSSDPFYIALGNGSAPIFRDTSPVVYTRGHVYIFPRLSEEISRSVESAGRARGRDGGKGNPINSRFLVLSFCVFFAGVIRANEPLARSLAKARHEIQPQLTYGEISPPRIAQRPPRPSAVSVSPAVDI